MPNPKTFMLFHHQVPVPPESGQWSDVLFWLLAVMDRDDNDISFVAASLAMLIENEGLTRKQSDSCGAISNRIVDDYYHESLYCQSNIEDKDDITEPPDKLCDMAPQGNA